MAPSFQLLILFAGLIGTLALAALAFAGPSGSKASQRRLESVRERHSRSTEVAAQAQMRRILQSRKNTKMEGFAQQIIPNPALLRQRLERTGHNWTLLHYVAASAVLFLVPAVLLTMWGLPFPLAFFVGLFIGVGLPHFIVGKLIKRRIAKFTSRFPDAIDLMVRGLRSGLPITETMGVISDEVPGPIADEFRAVSDKMKIGRTMDVALQETADRLGTPEFQFFVITLAIQRETGGNLAETLGNLSEVLRKRAAMKLKIKAMSSESKASAWIVGSLPFIVFGMIWFINGEYMQKFFIDERLIITGGGGLIWMGLGVFIMAKMVDFEI
ncbi:type II secretion system F family protein [Sphingosinicella sp. BN140058]|uniref:type II secretion system F family protein n=1 Tax=Sphingosinicella sp. BN140058 TaxID=1892855 RepID=UPI001011053F|nr:type II secretion system F family protein [Sphingosinicella sp. BN140058]QAY79581.1 type II secretion system F family protein [Sphingosinicella sp. BN140058]